MDIYQQKTLVLSHISIQWVLPGEKYGVSEIEENEYVEPIIACWENDINEVQTITIFSLGRFSDRYKTFVAEHRLYPDPAHSLAIDVSCIKAEIEERLKRILSLWDLLNFVHWIYEHYHMYLNTQVPQFLQSNEGIVCQFELTSTVDGAKKIMKHLVPHGRIDRYSTVAPPEEPRSNVIISDESDDEEEMIQKKSKKCVIV